MSDADTRARYYVIYDQSCAFCRRSVDRISRLDHAHRFSFVPSQAPDLLQRFPVLSDQDLSAGLRVVVPDGRALAGADAVFQIARRLTRTAWFAWIYRVPGVRWLARRVYSWVAARRHSVAADCDAACRTVESSASSAGVSAPVTDEYPDPSCGSGK